MKPWVKAVLIVLLGGAGLGLLYLMSWVLYFVNFSESDVSDTGYHRVEWVIWLTATIWVAVIGWSLFRIDWVEDNQI